MPGAGKSLCAKHLEARGFYQFRFGGIVVDEVARRGLPLTPETERLVREDLRANEGMDAIAKRALPHLLAALGDHASVVIDGLYSQSELNILRPALGDDMIIVAITCDRALRYRRLAARPERPLTAVEAHARDLREIEHLEKGGPIALADYTLLNNGDPAAVLAALDALIARVGLRP
jgi:dephospho-CoA kinase